MTKITNISGFPEWLPEQKLIEDTVISQIRGLYSSFGFTPIETPSVELLSTLSSKGVVDKEIFSVRRLHSEGTEAELALHFDLTVPFARYTAQHFAKLNFPFKRYQLQRSWRGDRPQKGRFREFYQFDIDTIARENLPLSADAEVITVVDRAFSAIGAGPHKIRMNNRKVLLGFYRSLGLNDAECKSAVTAVDKLDKLGVEGVRKELVSTVGISEANARKILELSSKQVSPAQLAQTLGEFGVTEAEFLAGQSELAELIRLIPPATLANIVLDFSLARGLEYYTGVIFEVSLLEHPEFATAAGGGRYEDLASQFTNQRLPGVGASIGISRIMELIFDKGLRTLNKKTTSQLMVAVYNEDQRPKCQEFADSVRAHGVAVEVYLSTPKLGKQIEYAEAKGIRFVAFLNDSISGDQSAAIQVKDLLTKEQRVVIDSSALAQQILAH